MSQLPRLSLLALVLGLAAAGCKKPVMEVTAEPVAGQDLQQATVTVNHGYSPRIIHAQANMPVKLTFLRDETKPSCADTLVLPAASLAENTADIQPAGENLKPVVTGEADTHDNTATTPHGNKTIELPNNKPVSVTLAGAPHGTRVPFHCDMDMMRGTVVFEAG